MNAGRDPGRQSSTGRKEDRRRSRRLEWQRRDRRRPWGAAGTTGQKRGLRMKLQNERRHQNCWDTAKAILSAGGSRRWCGPYS